MSENQPLLVIRERDVGLFSMFWQVLNTLYLLETRKISRAPVAIFGEALVYFDQGGHEGRKTVWEYYFEPLVPGLSEDVVLARLGSDAFELLELKRRQLELRRGQLEFPDELHKLTPLSPADEARLLELNGLLYGTDWSWTEAFHPIVDGLSLDSYVMPFETAKRLARQFVRPREHILKKASSLFEKELKGHYVIGAHVRGTDGFSAPSRGHELPFDRYFEEIDRRLAEHDRESCRVFLATDEESVVERFADELGDLLVCYDAVRSSATDAVFGKGPTGQVMPGYIGVGSGNARQNGDDAVVEYVLLGMCPVLLHNESGISSAARLSVPESICLRR